MLLLVPLSLAAQESTDPDPNWPEIPDYTLVLLSPDDAVMVSITDQDSLQPALHSRVDQPLWFYLPNGNYDLLLDSGNGVRDDFDLYVDGGVKKYELQSGTSGVKGIGVVFIVLGTLVTLAGIGANSDPYSDSGSGTIATFAGIAMMAGGIGMAVNGNGDMEELD
jgi:hypothetical protein